MMTCIRVNDIVMEASSKDDRRYMATMNKDDIHQINGQSVQNLYDLTMQKSNIDFADIPDSKGDFEKCKYYDNTVKCLEVIKELRAKNNINNDDVIVIKTAVSNMLKFRPQFTMGFRMNHDFMKLTYNSLAMAIVDATAMLTRSYVDFIMTAEPVYKVNEQSDNKRGCVALQSLKSFNSSCDNGSMAQALEYMLSSQKKALTGTAVIVPGVVVVILLSIVPVIRELIYFYYSSRVKISDYLKMESDFLEMNSMAVSASTKPPKERKEIARKQEKMVSSMRKLSDKIMIDHVDTEDVVKKNIKDDSSLFSLNNIDKQINNNKMKGNDISFI